jgi:hypothetical protein
LVRRLKTTTAYAPGTDQFRRVRQAIQREAVPDANTPGEFAEVVDAAHERRRESFRRLLDGYLSFASDHDVARAAVPALSWTYRSLRVTIRPHLALTIDDATYVIRFHYAAAPPSRQEVQAVVQVLDNAGATAFGQPAVLDLRRSVLLTARPDHGWARRMRAEAAELLRLWRAR